MKMTGTHNIFRQNPGVCGTKAFPDYKIVTDLNGNILFNIPDVEAKTNEEIIEKITQFDDKKPENLLEKIVKAGYIAEGQQVYFEYGPKGYKKQRFDGVVRKNGIEVDSVVSSPSISS